MWDSIPEDEARLMSLVFALEDERARDKTYSPKTKVVLEKPKTVDVDVQVTISQSRKAGWPQPVLPIKDPGPVGPEGSTPRWPNQNAR